MKQLILVFVFLLLASHADAFNVLEENRKYKQELDYSAAKQYAENPRWIMYYKGKANYAGVSYPGGNYRSTYRTSPASISDKKKALYAKKGVKFKVDEAKKQEALKKVQEKNEEVKKQQSSSSNKNYNKTASEKTLTKTTEIKTNLKVQEKTQETANKTFSNTEKKHNEDAE